MVRIHFEGPSLAVVQRLVCLPVEQRTGVQLPVAGPTIRVSRVEEKRLVLFLLVECLVRIQEAVGVNPTFQTKHNGVGRWSLWPARSVRGW